MLHLALDRGAEHELHDLFGGYGNFCHGDGWGVGAISSGEFNIYKGKDALYQNSHLQPIIEKLNSGAEVCVFHVRKASVGSLSLNNSHPFYRRTDFGNVLFVHNGTIREPISTKLPTHGHTDTEILFMKVIEEKMMDNSKGWGDCLKDVLNRLDPEKGSTYNIFMLTDSEAFVATGESKGKKKYLSLSLFGDNEKLIISSEPLLDFADEGSWETIEQGNLLSVDLDSRKYKVSPLV